MCQADGRDLCFLASRALAWLNVSDFNKTNIFVVVFSTFSMIVEVPRQNMSLLHAVQEGTHTAVFNPQDSREHPWGNASSS